LIDPLKRILALRHCPVALPWFKTLRRKPAINLIHQLAFQLEGNKRRGLHKRLGYCIVWPLMAVVQSTRELGCRHRLICARYGVSVWRLWFESVYYALFFNIAAGSYYRFELWEPRRKRQIFHLVQDFEVRLILRHINRRRDTDKLDDKHRFHEFASELGLPVPQWIATFRRGKLLKGSDRFPERDLFVKNNNANGGLAAARLDYDDDTGTWTHCGKTFNEQELTEALLRQSLKTNLILQVCERLHSELLPFSNGAVATLRVMSIRQGGGGACLLHVNMRMPVGDSVVDNFHAGGLSARVSDGGILSAGWPIEIGYGPFHHHPDTGAPITGTSLPFYHQMAALALDAHNAMPEFCTVAWDIAMADRGPVIIEANSWWGLELFQHSRRNALGTKKLLEFVIREWHQGISD